MNANPDPNERRSRELPAAAAVAGDTPPRRARPPDPPQPAWRGGHPATACKAAMLAAVALLAHGALLPAFGASAPLSEEDGGAPDFGRPEIVVRLESVDAAVEAAALALRAAEGIAPEAARAKAKALADAALASAGLRFVRRDLPVFAGLWNASPSHPAGTDWVALLPMGDDDDPPRVVASRPELRAAAPAAAAARRTKPDAVLSATVPSTWRASRAFRRERPAVEDAWKTPFSFALEPSGAFAKAKPYGGLLSFWCSFVPTGRRQDSELRASLALDAKEGLRLALELAPKEGTRYAEGLAAEPAALPEEALRSVPGGSLAWFLREPDAAAPDDRWMSLFGRLALADTPVGRRRAPAYEGLARALEPLAGATNGAVRAALAPAGGGLYRAEAWREVADPEAVRALGRAFARLRESEWEIAGTNALALFRPEVAETAPDGLSGTLRPGGALARLLGPEAALRTEIAEGEARATLGPEGAPPAEAEPRPVALDGVRRWFPEFRPSTVLGVRLQALRARLSPGFAAEEPEGALVSAFGRYGDGWVWTLAAPPEQLFAGVGWLAEIAEKKAHAEGAESEPHAEFAEDAESGGTAPHGVLPPAAGAATPLSEGGEPNDAETANEERSLVTRHSSLVTGAAAAAAPPPPLHADFVSAVYLPLLEREVLAPLEGRDPAAPWRADALAAVRDWLARVARGEARCDPSFLARARSAAGRGCGWPVVRYLAGVAAYDGSNGSSEHLAAACRSMEDAVRAAARDPLTTDLAQFLLLRDLCARRRVGGAAARATAAHHGAPEDEARSAEADRAGAFAVRPGGEGGDAWTRALAARYGALAAARPWTGEEARALWWLGRGAFAEGAAADAVAALVWGAGGDGRGGASTNAWLREMSAGAAELRRAWAARGEGAEAGLADDARAGWERHRARAAERFAAAAALEPSFPEAPLCLVACWLGRPAEARRWLDEAVRREFDCPGARSAYLWGLRPRWGGSVAAMVAFGDDCLAALDEHPGADPRAALVWAEARFAAASELGDRWEEAFRGAGVVEAADRLGAALAAAPGAGVPERRDALWLPVWPLYANNRFDRLARACDKFGSALGNACPLVVDFDESHPMHRYQFGLAFGIDGYHSDKTSAALHRWRVEGDPAGAAALLEPLVGKTRYGTGLDDWEQSWICGALAELGAELAPAGGAPYTLLPRSGRSGRSKFWASWNESVRAAAGAWTAPGPGAGEMRSVAPVLPADFALALAVRPLDDGAACRFYALPDVGEWDTAARPALLLERDETGWTLGWATLRHIDDAETFGGDELADRFGPRTALVEDADGLVRLELVVRGGDATVRTPSGELPALSLPGRYLRAPHRLGFAGLGFRLVEATARAP